MSSTEHNHEVPECSRCQSVHDSLFSGLDSRDLTIVSESKSCRAYERGEMIFYADQQPSGIYCIHSGKVKVYKVGHDGREQILRLAHEGDTLGYRSLISGEAYGAFAVPLEHARLCHIPRTVFFSQLTTSHALSERVMALLSSELKAAEEQIVKLAQKPMRERLAETLLLLKETYGTESDGETLAINLTRAELANVVGAVPESTMRLLSKLKDEGMIDLVGRKIKITNHRALVIAANIDD